MVQTWVQADALLMDSLLAPHYLGLGVFKAFTPALRIDGIATVGDAVFNLRSVCFHLASTGEGFAPSKSLSCQDYVFSQYDRL